MVFMYLHVFLYSHHLCLLFCGFFFFFFFLNPPLFDFTCVLCLLLQVFCLVIVAFVSPVLSSPVCLLLALYVLFISCRSISVAGLLCVFLVSIILCVSVVIRAFASCFSVLHVFCLFHVCESVCLFVHLLNFCLWLCCLPDDFCVCVMDVCV